MTPRQAAQIIGCSPQQVRTLIRAGVLKARPIPSANNPAGYEWQVPRSEALRYAGAKPKRGWPRGKPRKPQA